ncbi:hypothetical protein ACFL41_00165 [Gemmatimonadota bacterium]
MATKELFSKELHPLIEAILRLPREHLATILALLEQTRFHLLLERRITDHIPSANLSFERALEDEADVLAQRPPAELSIRVLIRLREMLGLPPYTYSSEQDFSDSAEEITTTAILHKRNVDANFNGDSVADLVRSQLFSLMLGLGSELDGLNKADQQHIALIVREFIQQLPDDDKQLIFSELGTDQLTNNTVLQALLTGEMSTIFARIVNTAGFPFYSAVTYLLASIAGYLGIVLPFTTYSRLSSLIAVVSSPLFLVPQLISSEDSLNHNWDWSVKDDMIPIIVAQLTVAGIELGSNTESGVLIKELQETWAKTMNL